MRHKATAAFDAKACLTKASAGRVVRRKDPIPARFQNVVQHLRDAGLVIDNKHRRGQPFGDLSTGGSTRPMAPKTNSWRRSMKVPTITLVEAFEWYFKAKARKRSLQEDQRIAKHLKAEFGEQALLSELTASRISLYQEKLLAVQHSRRGGALSAASINRPLALLRGLLRMACRKWEVLTVAPVIELEKEGQGRLRWLTHEEAIRLLDACRKQRNAALADLVELALYTGMRQGELLGLTWGSVDRSRGVVLLEETKGRSAARAATLRACRCRPGPACG